MSHILIIGGGFAGCVVANELIQKDHKITLIEKSSQIGGKVKDYGCKASDKCNNCGVCLANGLWEKVDKNNKIDVYREAFLSDLKKIGNKFAPIIKIKNTYKNIEDVSGVVVAAGFDVAKGAHIHIEGQEGIITGLSLEKIMCSRSQNKLLGVEPKNIAFIQCFGSRDKKEHAMYCSKVCCAYSTRGAKVIKHYYPNVKISFFYMELQEVTSGNCFKDLVNMDMEFLKCRPLKISNKVISYEDSKTGERLEKEFDLIVLSEGIRPPEDADILAELCELNQDAHGFLKSSEDEGVYVVGCASGPAKISEVYARAVAAANRIDRFCLAL